MRSRWVGAVAVATAMILTGGGARAADGPNVTARAAVIMDADSGELLWAREPDLELPPASTTKVMTAILALESGGAQRAFAASREACSVVPSKVNLRPGQRLSLEDLVYAILLNSANDASVVIAENLAGSVPAFADRMTARARQLGALHTHYENPHGLTAENHYSTAHDLATIFRHALTVPRFRDIIGTKAIAVSIEDSRRKILLHSHNRLLEGYRIPVIGKTGYTVPAKKCFVGAGSYDGRELIVAVLGSTDLWGDTRRLFEFGFGDAWPVAPVLQQAKLRPAGSRAPARGSVRAASRVSATSSRSARSIAWTGQSASSARSASAATKPRSTAWRAAAARTSAPSTGSRSGRTRTAVRRNRRYARWRRRSTFPPSSSRDSELQGER